MSDVKFFGMYQGIVTNNNDTEKRGRIKCKIPEVLGSDVESAWCDPVVPVAYDNGGDFCLPVKKEAVWIMFIAGDSNRPVYLGGWWQKEKTPLATNYNNLEDIRIISYGDCTLTFRDGIININVGEGSSDLKIENSKITVTGNLTVTGDINASGNIHSDSAISANSSVSGASASFTNSMRSGSITTTGNVTANTLSCGNITSTGSITASGEVHGSNI